RRSAFEVPLASPGLASKPGYPRWNGVPGIGRSELPAIRVLAQHLGARVRLSPNVRPQPHRPSLRHLAFGIRPSCCRFPAASFARFGELTGLSASVKSSPDVAVV